MDTLIITAEGNVFRAVPNMKPKKNRNGTWTSVQDGFTFSGCPLCRIAFYNDPSRSNPVLDMIKNTFHVVVL